MEIKYLHITVEDGEVEASVTDLGNPPGKAQTVYLTDILPGGRILQAISIAKETSDVLIVGDNQIPGSAGVKTLLVVGQNETAQKIRVMISAPAPQNVINWHRVVYGMADNVLYANDCPACLGAGSIICYAEKSQTAMKECPICEGKGSKNE